MKDMFVADLVPWLFHLGMSLPRSKIDYSSLIPYSPSAMSPSEQLVGQRGAECLLALARYSRPVSSFSDLVVATLLRFGAHRSALEHLGLELPANDSVESIDAERRYELLARAMESVKCFAQFVALISGYRVASLIFHRQEQPYLARGPPQYHYGIAPYRHGPSRLAGAADRSGSHCRHTRRVYSIQYGWCFPAGVWASRAIPTLKVLTSGVFQEAELCSRVLTYAAEMAPPNRALLLSAFCGGSPQTARIGRWLARRLLFVDEAEVRFPTSFPRIVHSSHSLWQTYCDHPCLNPLIELITPDTGSKTIFDVMGNAREPTFYEDLAAHVEMLNVCFNDIDGYVLLDEQGKLLQPPPDVTMSPNKDKPATTLDRVCMVLQRLHGRIGAHSFTCVLTGLELMTNLNYSGHQLGAARTYARQGCDAAAFDAYPFHAGRSGPQEVRRAGRAQGVVQACQGVILDCWMLWCFFFIILSCTNYSRRISRVR